MPRHTIDALDNLLKSVVEKLLRKIIKFGPARKKHGCVPKMVTVSKDLIGVWLVSSFYERANSVANQVVAMGNTLLNYDKVDMLKNMWMNIYFMIFMIDLHGNLLLKNLEYFIEDKEEVQSLNINAS